MKLRLWYPQLDVYDTIRRMALLLQSYKKPLGIERLYIIDFFLATPTLLHNTSMSRESRDAFMELKIPRPEKCFVKYPAPQLLFHKMEPIQKNALSEMSCKELIDSTILNSGKVQLTELGLTKFSITKMASEEEINICDYLANSFLPIEEIGNFNIRKSTGLRRPS